MSTAPLLNAAEAARRLGISPKALKLYEQRGLLTPLRSAAGWRVYGAPEMARGREIAVLRGLGLSLAQVARVLGGNGADLEPALTAHQGRLEEQIRHLAATIGRVKTLRAEVVAGLAPASGDLADLLTPCDGVGVSFDLPWPWGGEAFELRRLAPITFLTGPLGCGKTRLALKLAECLPNATFLGLDRAADMTAVHGRLAHDAAAMARVDAMLAWLVEDGATVSDALVALIAGLTEDGPGQIVVDMVEQGLDQPTQGALIAGLRRRGAGARPLILMTRSSAILDLAAVGPDETILYCPANHAPPMIVAAYPGAAGYESVATCLGTPEVRARTEGMRAWLPGKVDPDQSPVADPLPALAT